MYSPDDVNPIIWILVALVGLGFFGLIAAGIYDDYRKWRNRKKGAINLVFSFSNERLNALLSGASKAEQGTMGETITNKAGQRGQ
jgi:UDP-N-acetylmuramyl pentapeptide phosphotransferase/UDP-N-acetylglucosamine-1-phosphate transferase